MTRFVLRSALAGAALALFAVVPSLAGAAAPARTARVTVDLQGHGLGHVTIKVDDTGPETECPNACLLTVPVGTTVHFHAAAASDSYFAGFGEPCAGTPEDCGVLVSSATRISATFQLRPTVSVGVQGSGTGTVTARSGGAVDATTLFVCPPLCSGQVLPGTQVTLTAEPAPGSAFARWEECGKAREANVCTFTVGTDPVRVAATFRKLTPITVTLAGAGEGAVTSQPAGIACGTDCSGDFAAGTKVTLAAAPDADSVFAGWSGDCSGPTCSLTAGDPKHVTATFRPNTPGTALAGDFNGDGKADIATFSALTGNLRVGLSDGEQLAFTTWGALSGASADSWVDIRAGDLDGDGRTDLVARVKESGQWWTARSTGHSFTTGLWDTWSPALNWVDVQIGDVNGDGRADLVGRVKESGQWWTARSTGHSFTTSLWDTWSPALNWVDVRLGDVNGDGRADLAGRVKETGQWWVSRSTGETGQTTLWDVWSPALSWVDVRMADFDGDGRSDLAGRVKESGQWWVSRSTGAAGATTLWDTWSPALTWVDVLAGDFNGDGRAGLVGRVKQNGEWWHARSGGTSFATTLWDAWSPEVSWVEVQTGDYDGDGKTDVIGFSPSTNRWYVARSKGAEAVTTAWSD